MGFGIPLDSWLRGPLRSWAESLLDERRLKEEGYFDAQTVRSAWAGHLEGQSNPYRIWPILVFQSWLDGTSSI
jgi:asparagine synthase (glutamine-hydrolysing)